MRELLKLDLDAVDVRQGLMALASLGAFLVFVAPFGTVGMTVALATLFVIVADRPALVRDRAIAILVMTLAGSVIALVAVWAGSEHLIVSSLLTFLVVAVATLAAGRGASWALRGLLLSVWTVVAISLSGDAETALQQAVAFAGGGLIAAGIIWLRVRANAKQAIEADAEAAARSVEAIIRSTLGWFALLRGGAAAIALWLGASLFPDHAIWASLTVIVVMRPRAGEAVAVAVLRSIGTLLGVIVAEAAILLAGGSDVFVAVAFTAAAFGMGALQKVNYGVFVAFLTTALVLAQELIEGSGEATAIDRLLATLLGSVIAYGAIAIGRVVLGRPVAGAESEPPTPGEDPTPG